MSYRIVSDSSSNVFSVNTPTEFKSVPLKILVDGKEYVDDENLNAEEMVEAVEKSDNTSSSCPNVFEWKEAFKDAKEIFALTITSKLSGSYNAARIAAEEYMEENPGTKVHVIDSMMTGAGPGLLIEKLEEFASQGLSFEAVKEKIENYKKHTQLLFSLESLQNLAKNGRVPMAVAKLAGFLSIRFIGKAKDGELTQVKVARGEKKTLAALMQEAIKMKYNGGKMIIGHCLNSKAAETLKNMFLEKFPNSNIRIEKLCGLNSYYAERGGIIMGFEDEGAI